MADHGGTRGFQPRVPPATERQEEKANRTATARAERVTRQKLKDLDGYLYPDFEKDHASATACADRESEPEVEPAYESEQHKKKAFDTNPLSLYRAKAANAPKQKLPPPPANKRRRRGPTSKARRVCRQDFIKYKMSMKKKTDALHKGGMVGVSRKPHETRPREDD